VTWMIVPQGVIVEGEEAGEVAALGLLRTARLLRQGKRKTTATTWSESGASFFSVVR